MRNVRILTVLLLIIIGVAGCSKSKESPGKSTAQAEGNGSGCSDNGKLKCTEKPGLKQGQTFEVLQDFSVDYGTNWTYFVDGKPTNPGDLSKIEGQEYCGMTVSEDNDGKLNLPPSLIQETGVAKVPKSVSPLTLYEISWYVETIFMSASFEDQKLGLVLACGKVKNGDLSSSPGDTSLSNILRHLKPFLKAN